MANPATAAGDVLISSTDNSKLLKGLWPQDMGDKCELRVGGPDAQGNSVLCL
ncbi:uncharacterized protein PFLUO_LOCUS8291 [Penicillium psychrofluorescens]|uniref:uncharacterized protein n=1 Tax=Penicillium psychrofluorescens TaxID=3158075 RepID=UPI003CCCB7C6